MTREQRRRLRIRQWAMRSADMINEVSPVRAPFLGSTCDYWAEFGGHFCECNHIPPTWESTYAHILATMEREGFE